MLQMLQRIVFNRFVIVCVGRKGQRVGARPFLVRRRRVQEMGPKRCEGRCLEGGELHDPHTAGHLLELLRLPALPRGLLCWRLRD